MRRVLFSVITIVVLVGVGVLIGRFLPDGSGAQQQQSIGPQIVTVPVLITATTDPEATPLVMIITATPPPGSIGALPTGIIDDDDDGAETTQQAAPTIDPALLDADAALQATATALPENCILHTLADGEFPSLIAEEYGASLPEMLAVNGLDDDTSRFLQIGDVLIVPLEGCPLTPVETLVVASDAGEGTEESTAEATEESTAEATGEAEATVAPTITLPPTAVNAQVQIVRIIGAGDITSEGVEIRNTGGVVDLTGWTLEDSEGNVFTFPEQRLFTNGLVTVYTRRGTNTPIALYWGRSQAVWGDSESVTLTDADGDVQASLRPQTSGAGGPG